MQGMPLETRPGFPEAKVAITEVQRQPRKEMKIIHFPANQRKRLNDKLDPKIRQHPEWLSENWEQYFTRAREKSSSSSSSSQWFSSTSWWSSQEWSSTWKGWQQHSWVRPEVIDEAGHEAQPSQVETVVVDFKKTVLEKTRKI